ncbi:MAG: FtsX-like permease family protein [Alteromonadaceae bacterium]|nr:FtsX-like permease family protein [Alteromonadaceae bacterium]
MHDHTNQNISNRSLLSFAVKKWLSEYREQDNSILRLCTIVLITVILCLTISSAGIQQRLQQNFDQLLGADLVISHSTPLPEKELIHLRALANETSYAQLVNVTLTNDEHWHAAQIKLVDEHYPLRGSLKVSADIGAAASDKNEPPIADTIWLDSRLYSALQLDTGAVLTIAETKLTVAGVLLHEPDRLLEGHSVAARGLVHMDSPLSQAFTGSPTTHRYSFNLSKNKLNDAITWAEQQLPHADILHSGSGHPLASFWQRTENFLGLVMVVLFFMAAITFHLAGRRQQQKQQYRLTLLFTMGLNNKQVWYMAIFDWMLDLAHSAIVATPLAIVGYILAMQQFDAFMQLNQQYISFPHAALLQSFGLVTVLLFIFQLPAWLNVSNISPSLLLKQGIHSQSSTLSWVFSGLAIALLAAFYSDNPLLTSITLTGLIISVIVMWAATWTVLIATEKLSRSGHGLFVFSIELMRQRLNSKATQIMGLGLCLTLMLFSFGLMKDFSNVLQQYTRSHDGNLLISQASQPQVHHLEQWAQDNHAQVVTMKPYHNAKLIEINGQPFAEAIAHPSEASARLKKPIRLHVTDSLPSNNRVVNGHFWNPESVTSVPANGQYHISVEQEVMTDMGFSIGDELTFLLNEELKTFSITASHVYQGGRGSITFWFQTPTLLNEHLPKSPLYMGSMEIPDGAWATLAHLWKRLPTLRMVTLQELTARFDQTLKLLQSVLSIFSGLILFMSILVMAASVQGHNQSDKAKNGLLLGFGLSKKQCLRLVIYEWLVTALIVGIGSLAGTIAIGHLMYQSQFSMPYQANWLWLTGIIALSTALIVALGAIFNRMSLRISVRELLQESI